MMAPSATLPKPSISPFEKMTKLFAAVGEEAAQRFEKAKKVYTDEMAWQNARRTPAPALPSVAPVLIAGLAVEVETGKCLILQQGLNVFGTDSLRIEQGRAEGSGQQAAKSYFTNDTVLLNGQKCVLKLFAPSRFSTRVQLQREVL